MTPLILSFLVMACIFLAWRHKFAPPTLWNSKYAIIIYGFLLYGLVLWIYLKPFTEKKENDPEGLYDFEQKRFKSIPYRILYVWGFVSTTILSYLLVALFLYWLVVRSFFSSLGFRPRYS